MPTRRTLSSRPAVLFMPTCRTFHAALPYFVIPTRRTLSSRPAVLCHPDPPYFVIPTAAEGSQPVGRRSFDFAQDDKLVRNPNRRALSSQPALLCQDIKPAPRVLQRSRAAPFRSIRARLWVCDFQIERAPCLSETSCANAENHKPMGPIAKGLHGFAHTQPENPSSLPFRGIPSGAQICPKYKLLPLLTRANLIIYGRHNRSELLTAPSIKNWPQAWFFLCLKNAESQTAKSPKTGL